MLRVERCEHDSTLLFFILDMVVLGKATAERDVLLNQARQMASGAHAE